MTITRRGKSDYLALGDWNTICFECGRKFKASIMRKHWQGYWVCPAHWEPRQTQDFVKGVPDMQAPPWVQPPPANSFVEFCTPNDTNDIPGLAIPGCAIPGFVAGGFDWSLAQPVCAPVDLTDTSYIAPGCTVTVCTVLTLDARLEIDGTLRITSP